MYDTLSEYKTQLVAKVQDFLQMHYGFSGHDNIRPLIVELLYNDNFTYPNLKDVNIGNPSRLITYYCRTVFRSGQVTRGQPELQLRTPVR